MEGYSRKMSAHTDRCRLTPGQLLSHTRTDDGLHTIFSWANWCRLTPTDNLTGQMSSHAPTDVGSCTTILLFLNGYLYLLFLHVFASQTFHRGIQDPVPNPFYPPPAPRFTIFYLYGVQTIFWWSLLAGKLTVKDSNTRLCRSLNGL